MDNKPNTILAGVTIVLSILVFTSMLPQDKIGAGPLDLRALLLFLYLVPIGIAAFYFGFLQSILVCVCVAAISSVVFCWQQYAALPFQKWQAKDFAGYIAYLAAPLFQTGIIWQLVSFLILAGCLGYFFQYVRKLKLQVQGTQSDRFKQDTMLAGERKRFADLQKKYADDINRLTSFIVTLSDMAREIPSVLEVEGLYTLIMQKCMKLLSATKCAIFGVEAATNVLRLICYAGYQEEVLKGLKLTPDEESGLVGWCAKYGKFLSKEEIQQDPYKADLLRNEKFPVLYCQPILQRGQVVAVICIGEVERQLEQLEAVRLTALLGNLSSIAIENAQLMERTREQAIRDGLTGLYNHRYFHELLEARMKEIQSEGGVLCVMMTDVDHFKKFNDTYGHQAGDLVLQETAKVLRLKLTKEDIAARYGGEEFVFIVCRKDASQIKELAEKMRKGAESSIFKSGKIDLNVTVSIGCSFYQPDKDKDLKKNQLIKQADEALYKAKETGRNRVCFYEG